MEIGLRCASPTNGNDDSRNLVSLSYGNENWESDDHASDAIQYAHQINDLPI